MTSGPCILVLVVINHSTSPECLHLLKKLNLMMHAYFSNLIVKKTYLALLLFKRTFVTEGYSILHIFSIFVKI